MAARKKMKARKVYIKIKARNTRKRKASNKQRREDREASKVRRYVKHVGHEGTSSTLAHS